MPAVVMAQIVSVVGTASAEVALSLVMYRETGSALLAAVAIAAGFVPQSLSGALLTGLVQRAAPRAALVGANLVSAVLAALLAAPAVPVGFRLLTVAFLGAIVPVYNGIRAASLADLLAPMAFATARSLLRSLGNSSLVLGFLCGGTLAAAFGPRAVLLGNAASFAIAAALLRWGTAGTASSAELIREPRRVIATSLQALRFTLCTPGMRVIALSVWLPPAFASVCSGLSVVYSASIQAGGVGAGFLFASFAAGSVCGEVISTRFSPLVRRRAVPALMLLTQLPTIGFATTPPIVLAVVLRAVSGGGLAYLQGIDIDLIRVLEPDMRRSAMVVLSSGVMACQGLGIAAAGGLGSMLAPGPVIGASGAVGTAGCLALLTARRRLAGPRSPEALANAPANDPEGRRR